MTIEESLLGHVLVESPAVGWIKQDLQIGNVHGGLTNISPIVRPVWYVVDELKDYFDGVHLRKWLEPFPVGTKQEFTFTYYNDRDPAITLDPVFRAFMLWRE